MRQRYVPLREVIRAELDAQRRRLGLTQTQLAKMAGMTQQQVNKYLVGAHDMAGKRLDRLLKVLDLNPGKMMDSESLID